MRRPLHLVAAALLCALTSSSCSLFRPKPPEYAPEELASGLVIRDIVRPTESDDRAEEGEEVTVHYTMRLEDGTVVDSSLDRGRPVKFVLGSGAIRLPGLEQGLVGMLVLGKRRIRIPSDLAYGEAGLPPHVPPNSNLIVDVELFSAVRPEEAPDVVDPEGEAAEPR